MNKSVTILLKSGNFIKLDNFEFITYPNSRGEIPKVADLSNFYLYDRELTFVCKDSTLSLKSDYIEYIRVDNK